MENLELKFDELEKLIKNGKSFILLEGIYDSKFNVLIGTEKVLTEKDILRVRERCPERLSKPVHVRTTIPHYIEDDKRVKWAFFVISVFENSPLYKDLSKDRKEFVIRYLKNILSSNDYLVWKISQMKSFSKKIFDHTLNTAFISLISYQAYSQMVQSGMIDAHMVETLIASSLLHDIGLMKLPLELAEKKRIDLGPQDTAFFQHSLESFQIIQSENERHEIHPDVLKAVLEHEEFLDGTGTPRGVNSGDLPIQSRILSISNYFELLLSGDFFIKPRHYRDSIAKLRLDKAKFEPQLVECIDISFKYMFQS